MLLFQGAELCRWCIALVTTKKTKLNEICIFLKSKDVQDPDFITVDFKRATINSFKKKFLNISILIFFILISVYGEISSTVESNNGMLKSIAIF